MPVLLLSRSLISIIMIIIIYLVSAFIQTNGKKIVLSLTISVISDDSSRHYTCDTLHV